MCQRVPSNAQGMACLTHDSPNEAAQVQPESRMLPLAKAPIQTARPGARMCRSTGQGPVHTRSLLSDTGGILADPPTHPQTHPPNCRNPDGGGGVTELGLPPTLPRDIKTPAKNECP